MKTKNILGLVAIVAVAVAMAFNVTVSNKKTDTASLLALKNVEALASESGGGITCNSGSYGQCFTSGYKLCMQGEYNCYSCVFTGYQRDNCWCPC